MELGLKILMLMKDREVGCTTI